jgi:2'-5' RNA ligase
VDIGAAVRQQVKAAIQTLSASTTAVRWVAPENLHLTLKFLGDVEDKELYTVCQSVSRAVASLSPFRTFCQGVGAFPSRQRPRTIWVGMDDRGGKLQQLQEGVELALAELGFPRELRSFRPHVTIGRMKPKQRRLGRLLEELASQAQVEFGPVTVDECVIFSSDLTPDGPIYTPLGHAPLGGD